MLELNGKNLPQRQQELNAKVKETVLQNSDFNEIKLMEEKSDVDRLFKIDVASEYKEVSYILETFACGDPLYISRALKCTWLFTEEYAHFFNPDYLHNNIFPFMSVKMIKKLLTSISIHVRNEGRALTFYKYCIENQFNNVALKFLLFTSDKHKIEYIQTVYRLDHSIDLVHFIGNSFEILEIYLQKLKSSQISTCILQENLRHLYSCSNNKYLDLFENYVDKTRRNEFGLRISKDILIKHKQRVLAKPELYINSLNVNVVTKHSTVEEAKFYFKSLLPIEVQKFWKNISSSKMSSLLKKIPENERYNFLRQVFIETYPEEQFESTAMFYQYQIYLLMSAEEREAWALKYLKDNTEWLNTDDEFIWCKYMRFETAFREIKKYIYITDSSVKRAEMLQALVDVAKAGDELEIVLNYYYDRHSNEKSYDKIEFVEKVYENFNVFKFNEKCWMAFNKILYSLKVYEKDFFLDNFRTLSIIYHILNNKTIPETLQADILSETRLHFFKGHQSKLSENECDSLYNYYIKLYTNKLEKLQTSEYKKKNKTDIREIVSYVILLFKHFKKSTQDYPDIVKKYINLDPDYFKTSDTLEEISQDILIRQLKKDCNGLMATLPDLKQQLSASYSLQLNRLMRKIKIYFSNDIVNQLLSVFENWLKNAENMTYRSYNVIICCIFLIANEDYKINFMAKYAPTKSKIAHDEIDRHVLKIQESICRFLQYSRPPISLQDSLKYLKGDYVHYCLPLFNSYAMKLPRPLLLQFTSAILDAPASLQKHGLRIAFKCFNVDELQRLILDIWNKTKNISLRKVVYESLFKYIANNITHVEKLYETLKVLTLDINENDDDEIFNNLDKVHALPTQLKSDFLEVMWKTVEKLPDRKLKNYDRKQAVIRRINSMFHTVNKEFCRIQIIDDFITEMLFEKKIHKQPVNYEIKNLIMEKWTLTAKYIVNFDNPEQMNRSLEIASVVIKECVEMWGCGDYMNTTRQFLPSFLDKILSECYWKKDKCETIPILKHIINLIEPLPFAQTYLLHWRLNLTVITKQIMEHRSIEAMDGEVSYDHLKEEEIAADFVDKFVSFLLELKYKQLLFTSLYQPIAEQIPHIIETITYGTTLDKSNLILYICVRLAEVDMLEAVVITTLFLPTHLDEKYKELVSQVAYKISTSKFEEIQALFHYKIADNDYKKL